MNEGEEMDDRDSEEAENDNDHDYQLATPREREYPEGHKGPFVIFIKEKNSPLSHITISQRLNEKFRGKIKSLVKVHRSKIRLEVSDRTIVGQVLKEPLLSGYHVYIPAENVEIDGLIYLEESADLNDIIKNGYGKFSHPNVPMVKVTNAYRFRRQKRQSQNSSPEYENTEAVRISFQGTALPRWLLIHNLLIPVKLYFPKLMSCKTCMGDHHTSKYCTTKNTCLKCKGNHTTSECPQKTPWCPHCRKEVSHESREDCDAFFARSRKLVNQAKQKSRKSYADAVRQTVPTANSFSRLMTNEEDDDSDDHFDRQDETTNKRKKVTKTQNIVQKKKRSGLLDGDKEFWANLTPTTSHNSPSVSQNTSNKNIKKTMNYEKNNNNVTQWFEKAAIAFIASIGIPEPLNSIIIAFLMPLIREWLPKLSNFLSTFFGNMSSFGATSPNPSSSQH